MTALLACSSPRTAERPVAPHLDDRLRFWLPADAGDGAELSTPEDPAASTELLGAPCGPNRVLLEARDWSRQGRDVTAQLAYLGLHPRQVTVDDARGVRQLRPIWPYLSGGLDDHFLGGAIATLPDGSLVSLTAWLDQAPGDELEGCRRLADEILGSVRAGNRSLDLAGGRKLLPTGYEVTLPPGWRLVERHAREADRAVYVFAPVRPLEGSGPWLRLVFARPDSAASDEAPAPVLDEARPFSGAFQGDPDSWARDREDPDPYPARAHTGSAGRYLVTASLRPFDGVTPPHYQTLLDIADSMKRVPNASQLALKPPLHRYFPPPPREDRSWQALVGHGEGLLEHMPDEARAVFTEACDLDVRACRLAGVWMLTHQRQVEGLAFLDRGCKGDCRSCYLAEVARAAGDGTVRALCVAKEADACDAALEDTQVWLGRCLGGDAEVCRNL